MNKDIKKDISQETSRKGQKTASMGINSKHRDSHSETQLGIKSRQRKIETETDTKNGKGTKKILTCRAMYYTTGLIMSIIVLNFNT